MVGQEVTGAAEIAQVRDANGNTLQDGDTVTVIKDLKISLVRKIRGRFPVPVARILERLWQCKPKFLDADWRDNAVFADQATYLMHLCRALADEILPYPMCRQVIS